MDLTYSQTTGFLTDDKGVVIAKCWAGRGDGKNNPAKQAEKGVGPLPRGKYTIGPWEAVHGHLGPLVAPLTMIEGEGDSLGRDDFFIHGPAKDPNEYGQESKGCIVTPRIYRQRVANLTQGEGHTITVVV